MDKIMAEDLVYVINTPAKIFVGKIFKILRISKINYITFYSIKMGIYNYAFLENEIIKVK